MTELRRLLRDYRLRAFCLAIWAIGWVVALVISLQPIDMPEGVSDKALHLAGYAALTAASAGFCHLPVAVLVLALGTVAGSAVIECVQWLLPYRSFELLDIAANATGALLGAMIALAWLHLLVRPRPLFGEA